MEIRDNIIHRLAGTSWGCNARIHRSLASVYSTGKYYCPLWEHSVHTCPVYAQLNVAIRTMYGPPKSSPTSWLPVLAYIPPHPSIAYTSLISNLEGIQGQTRPRPPSKERRQPKNHGSALLRDGLSGPKHPLP